MDYDPQEALRHRGRPFGTAPLASHPNIARHQNHKFSGKALNLSRSFSATLAKQVRQTHTVLCQHVDSLTISGTPVRHADAAQIPVTCPTNDEDRFAETSERLDDQSNGFCPNPSCR